MRNLLKAAVLPSLMTLPGAMLVGISTPHKKSGLLFERYKKAFGRSMGRAVIWMSRPLSIRKCGGLRDGGGATHPDLDDERSDRFRERGRCRSLPQPGRA